MPRAAANARGEVPTASTVRDAMWRHAGLLRSRETLDGLVARLREWSAGLARIRGAEARDRGFRHLS